MGSNVRVGSTPIPATNNITMSLFFRNWLDEGFYEEDSMGDLTRLEDPIEIHRAQKQGNLYQHDGMGMSKVSESENIDLSQYGKKK